MKAAMILLSLIFVACASHETRETKPVFASLDPGKRQVAGGKGRTATEVLAGFLGCREALATAADPSWVSCVDPYVATADARRQPLIRFLMTPVQVGSMGPCTSEQSRALSFLAPDAAETLCFAYRDDRGVGSGAAVFLRADGELRLRSVHRLPAL